MAVQHSTKPKENFQKIFNFEEQPGVENMFPTWSKEKSCLNKLTSEEYKELNKSSLTPLFRESGPDNLQDAQMEFRPGQIYRYDDNYLCIHVMTLMRFRDILLQLKYMVTSFEKHSENKEVATMFLKEIDALMCIKNVIEQFHNTPKEESKSAKEKFATVNVEKRDTTAETILSIIEPSYTADKEQISYISKLMKDMSNWIKREREKPSEISDDEAEDDVIANTCITPGAIAFALKTLLESNNLNENLGMVVRLLSLAATKLEISVNNMEKHAATDEPDENKAQETACTSNKKDRDSHSKTEKNHATAIKQICDNGWSNFTDAYNNLTLITEKAKDLSTIGSDENLDVPENVLATCRNILDELIEQMQEAQSEVSNRFDNFRDAVLKEINS